MYAIGLDKVLGDAELFAEVVRRDKAVLVHCWLG
jgi:hypothetical protein